MYTPKLTALRALGVMLAHSVYTKYYGSPMDILDPATPHSLPVDTANVSDVEAAVKRNGQNATYNPEIISLYTIVECYVAFHVLLLFLRPAWNLLTRPHLPSVSRIVRDFFVHWSLSVAIYLSFLTVERYSGIA
ncbi:hypothetical protein F4824DRAFT_2777 [Ustulina deusta]|nr:hypothetical protein F4823DRAFT_122537 [Ustulina deusta]KAI3343270.1 hypothetical protein F4824DRAFT_2777 [Ustulina deusta]